MIARGYPAAVLPFAEISTATGQLLRGREAESARYCVVIYKMRSLRRIPGKLMLTAGAPDLIRTKTRPYEGTHCDYLEVL